MIVCKFGGTSVGDAAAIGRLTEIVRARLGQRPVVVVSALSKITDALLGLADGAPLEPIIDRHQAVADGLGIADLVMSRIRDDATDLAQWLTARGNRPLSASDLDHLVSHGELWSSRIVAAALTRTGLPADWIDARHVIITDATFTRAAPNDELIAERAGRVISPLIAAGRVPVTQGFISATESGQTTTLGRGGSDYSASLLGAALGAERVEIWTDVDGLLTADPRIVPEAQLLLEASYDEAAELAAFGAKVLHPATQLPLIEAGIPCWIKNSFAPDRPGTRILAGAVPHRIGASPVRSIAWKKGITVVNVRAPRRLGAVEFHQNLFAVFARHQIAVEILASSEVNVSVTIEDTSRLAELTAELAGLGQVTVFGQRAIVAVIGVDLRGTRGFAARLFNAVKEVNIEVISQGASEINVTFVVQEDEGPAAVRALHHEFFGGAASARATGHRQLS